MKGHDFSCVFRLTPMKGMVELLSGTGRENTMMELPPMRGQEVRHSWKNSSKSGKV